MALTVLTTDDPVELLDGAGPFLHADPVRHNVILTVLELRRRRLETGCYWSVVDGDEVVGVAMQSPVGFLATLTPMPGPAVGALVTTVADQRVVLPGIGGEAATAAAFAGRWTERTGVGATVEGQRIYEVDEVRVPTGVPGGGRLAAADDLDDVADLLQGFADETGEPLDDARRHAADRIADGRAWLWEDDGAVALAGTSVAVAGVRRVGPVYTPPERRRRGYGAAVTAAASAHARARGERGILYTELANATSNGIYRAIGYRAVAEVLRYRFLPRAGAETRSPADAA